MSIENWKRWITPTSVVAVFCLLFLGIVILSAGTDPLVLAEIGTRYSQGDINGSEGYDGQFVYYIARDLRPVHVSPLLDVPAYRFQRILLPLLSRLLSFGSIQLVGWMLPAVNLAGHILGVCALSKLLVDHGVNRWYALVYGLWIGFLLALRLDLPEPLAYGLVAAALLAEKRGNLRASWIYYGLALFAKEVVVFFVLAQLLVYLLKRRWDQAAGMTAVSLLPFGLFQLWLWRVFGQFGLGSGGEMATPFELIHFMGIWRIGSYSLLFLGAILVIYLPYIILPTLWGLWQGIKRWRHREVEVVTMTLLLNAFVLLALPFSTYREPNAAFRFISGMLLAALLFAARYRLNKALRYSWLWLVLDVFLLRL